MRWCALLLLVGCGAAPGRNVDLAQEGPRFVLQGQCAPSATSTPVVLETITSTCMRSLDAPTLIETQAEFDALFAANCEQPSVDFRARRVLMVPSRGASEWFVFPQFVQRRDDALEVGLVIRPQGALPPDSMVMLERDGAIELRWCRSVCVARCDQAIP
jgi:hypothetical protein